MKKFLQIMCLVMLSVLVWPARLNAVNISSGLALKLLHDVIANDDYDYYQMNVNDNEYWHFFIDTEPMKGWEHKCCEMLIPKSAKSVSSKVVLGNSKVIELTMPPDVNMIAKIKTDHYGKHSKMKPIVRVSNNSAVDTIIASQTYALIISGGVNKNSNHERYWNDCSFIYQTLVNKYYIPKNNIYALISDGTDPAEDMRTIDYEYASSPLDLDFDGIDDIEYAATKENIKNVLSELSSKMSQDDHLFIYVIDHGGSKDSGTQSYICLWNNELLQDYELAKWLTPLTEKYVNVNVVLGQCFSGGFIDDLTMSGCVVATASDGSESSWSCTDKPFDEFVYQWTSAINGADSEGNVVDSDLDSNGIITISEAFEYAKSTDTAKETPQYSSIPYSVGEDLAFNQKAESVSLFIKDNDDDSGKEPNTSTNIFWNSPDVWVRNKNDSIDVHENPYCTEDHTSAVIYVRVGNRGKKKSDGKQWLHINWAKASTLLLIKTWLGKELYQNSIVTGEHLRAVNIPPIEAGGDTLLAVNWALPLDLLNTTSISNSHHFCLLARILNTFVDDSFRTADELSSVNVRGSRRIAQKNLSVISNSNLDVFTDVFVREIHGHGSSSLELHPAFEVDKEIFKFATVDLILSDPILKAWKNGGYVGSDIKYKSNVDPYKVTLLSSKSRLDSLQLTNLDFDKVSLKVNFTDAPLDVQSYTLNLIQKDENGEIVGGEAFVIESPSISDEPIAIQSRKKSKGYVLKPDDKSLRDIRWYDENYDLIGATDEICVSPTNRSIGYSLTAITEDGKLAKGEIKFNNANCIRFISPNLFIRDYVKVELSDIPDEEAKLQVISLSTGNTIIVKNIDKQSHTVSLDMSTQPAGVYAVLYVLDGQIVDSKKMIKSL